MKMNILILSILTNFIIGCGGGSSGVDYTNMVST